MEPDAREVSLEPLPWLGFEHLFDRARLLRHQLAALTGRPVQFNWFLRMDPQIATSYGHAGWVAERYERELALLRAAGDGFGLHPHCWRWSQAQWRWVADHGDPDWVDHCVRMSFETYDAVFGEPCRLIRFGDRFVSGRAVRLAAELGARFDLTVEPGMPGVRSLGRGSVATGRIPGQGRAPREPYRPSARDPVRPADGDDAASGVGLWMIPLTAIDPDALVPVWRRIGRRIKRPRSPRHRTAALVAAWSAPKFWLSIEEVLESSGRPYLAFAMRSDTLIRPALEAAFEEKMSALRAWPHARRLSFVTPDNVLAAMTPDAG